MRNYYYSSLHKLKFDFRFNQIAQGNVESPVRSQQKRLKLSKILKQKKIHINNNNLLQLVHNQKKIIQNNSSG